MFAKLMKDDKRKSTTLYVDGLKRYWWIGFILLIVAEFLLFRHYVYRELVPYFPEASDQSVYLRMVYGLYEAGKNHGVWYAIVAAIKFSHGPLFALQSTLFLLLTKAARFNALLPNFIYYVALQLVTFLTAQYLFKKIDLAIMALGLLLSAQVPFYIAGGIGDFRMDFIAFCLYGIFITAVLRSDVFLHRCWSFLAGIIAVYLVLFRLVTAPYLIGVLSCLGVYFFIKLVVNRHKTSKLIRTEDKNRLINLFICLTIIFLATLIVVWLNKSELYSYYFVAHINEKLIREKELGIMNWGSFLLYYPYSVYEHMRGTIWCFIIVILVIAGYMIINKTDWFNKKKSNRKENFSIVGNVKLAWNFLALTFLVPIVLLTPDGDKSPVGGSIVVTSVIWLFLYFMATIRRYIVYSKIFSLLATFIFVIGMVNQCLGYNRHFNSRPDKQYNNLTQMYLDIGDYVQKQGWRHINFSTDQLSQGINEKVLAVLYYEYRGKLLSADSTKLGGAMFVITKQEAMRALKKSDVVVFTIKNKPVTPYPFDAVVRAWEPQLQAYADSHFKRLGDYDFLNQTVRVYVR